MDSDARMDIETFASLADLRGLTIENDDMRRRLHDGYCLLQLLLDQIPENIDAATDPALIFLANETKINR